MKIDCCIAKDLIALYLDDACTEESRAIVEEHLKECPKCRTLISKLQEPQEKNKPPIGNRLPKFAPVVKKLHKRRIRTVILAIILSILGAMLLSFCCLTLIDMHKTANPIIYATENGVHNLTVQSINITEDLVGDYLLFTNNEQIKVTIESLNAYQGTVMLWDAENRNGFILVAEVSDHNSTCTFTGLTAAKRYRITCDGLENVSITVSDGRKVSFFDSMQSVFSELFEVIFH